MTDDREPYGLRLLAILAADATGYSRLMSLDDRGTVAALDGARAVFAAEVANQQGRVIDMAGDSVLASFDNATAAVQAALAVQRRLAQAAPPDTPTDRRLRFRIGIHVGDVIEKPDGSVYGDGVNIAARLEGLAEPGGVAVSQAVQGIVAGRIDIGFTDIGEQTVKNIARPVRVFRLRALAANETAQSAAALVQLALPTTLPAGMQPQRFGALELKPALRLLQIDGRAVTLGERAFDVLCALIEHRHRVVSKHELLELVWKQQAVEDSALQAQVSILFA